MPEAGFTRADLYRSGPRVKLADGAMDARGWVYEGGPLPLWARVNACRWCDGCQRPGLQGWTPTALDRTLILSYYEGKIHFLLCLSVELT